MERKKGKPAFLHHQRNMRPRPDELIELAAKLQVGLADRTRIAPTPSGLLHEGNAINFLITWAIARAHGARLLLRIDDLDAERARPQYVEDIFRSLEWLGIDWDEGPTIHDELERKWSQHYRIEKYHRAIQQLHDAGHLYACQCSRKDIQQASDSGNYPGTCRERNVPFDAEKVAWRLKFGNDAPALWKEINGRQVQTDLAKTMGDPIIRQKNGRPAYQIATLVDDLEFGVDMIVRGDDLITSTACQLHIAGLLENRAFSETRFLHHPLITDANGGKLSKSAGSSSLRAMRDSGSSPANVHQRAADLLRTII